MQKKSREELFWSKVDKSAGETGHWLWTAAKSRGGYGKWTYWDNGKRVTVGAHRFAYALTYGPIPAGLYVCHNCAPDPDTPACVNPRHLWLGTNRDNMQDASRKGTIASGDRNGGRIHLATRARGERNGSAKLTAKQVKAIRREWKPWYVTMPYLGKKYGVSESTIRTIVHRSNWRHLP